MDALESLTNLDGIIPGWLTAVSGLATGIPDRQKELYDVAHKSREATPPREAKKISASINETIRSDDLDEEDEEKVALVLNAADHGVVEPAEISRGRQLDERGRYSPPPFAARGFNDSQHSKRKRKNVSVQSHASGRATKFRHRNVGMVYYDGETQETLSKIHAQISAARNNLRKGKREAHTRNLLMDGSDDSDGGDIMFRVRFARKSSIIKAAGGKEAAESDPYSAVDKLLEEAQGLTERAAHQVIRDGECDDEITNIQERLKTARKTAGEEYTRLAEKPRVKQAIAEAELEKARTQKHREAAEAERMEVDPTCAAIEVDTLAVEDKSSYAAVFTQLGKSRTRREPLVRRRTSSLKKTAAESATTTTTPKASDAQPAPADESVASRTRMARMKQLLMQQYQIPDQASEHTAIASTASTAAATAPDSSGSKTKSPIESQAPPPPPPPPTPAATHTTPDPSAASPMMQDENLQVDAASYDLAAIMSMTRTRRGQPRRQAIADTARLFDGGDGERGGEKVGEKGGVKESVKEKRGGGGASDGLAPPVEVGNRAPSMEMHLD